MTHRAGERLFEAIGQLPEEMVLEAEQDALQEAEPDSQDASREAEPDSQEVLQEQDAMLGDVDAEPYQEEGHKPAGVKRRPVKKRLSGGKWKAGMDRLSSGLKYLPVAACFFILIGVAYFITADYKGPNGLDGSFSMADSGGEEGSIKENASGDGGISEDTAYDESEEDTAEAADDKARPEQSLPVRYDAYEGPVVPLTATGDTQNLRTVRDLDAVVDTEHFADTLQPLLRVSDTYRIKNTSEEDKTLQLVYPFPATLNLAEDLRGEILDIQDQDQEKEDVSYGIGDSISAYRHADPAVGSTLEDYSWILDDRSDYQANALQKTAAWEQEVSVYLFSDITIDETLLTDPADPGVIGVTVRGEHADVLTYGFDHTFQPEEEVSAHSFFVPEDQEQFLLIVTGEQEGKPEVGYYTNLDCEEEVQGITCTVEKKEMTYSDALYLCSARAFRKMVQDREEGFYAGGLPEYLDTDALYQALTGIAGEDKFYDTLVQRYQNTELKEIFERMAGEERMIYAMATVTIPAGKSVSVTARTQKRRTQGHYVLPIVGDGQEEDDTYDLLSVDKSRLDIKKAVFRLTLSEGWQVTEDTMGLQKKKTYWKAVLGEESYSFTVALDVQPKVGR